MNQIDCLRSLVLNFFGSTPPASGGAGGTSTQQKQYTGTPSNFALQSTDQTVFTLAPGEIGFIQNCSTDAPLAVRYGAAASNTAFNFILATCTAASDGKGGLIIVDNWIGVVSVAKMAGTASYIAWKMAP